MAIVVFVLGAIVGMAVLIFAFQNQEPVTLHFLYSWQTQPIPLFVVIMATAGSGFVIASLFGFAAYLRARAIVRQQRREIAGLRTELDSLRTLPLRTPSEAGRDVYRSDQSTTPSPDPLAP